MKELLLIRHGETDHNRLLRFTGHSDIPLNENGIRQARNLKPIFLADGVTRIYSSDLKRCRETAEIISGSADIIEKKELREMNFGIFETKTNDEIMVSHKDIFDQWQQDRIAYRIPEGESYREMFQRVLHVFEEIVQHDTEKIAVVTHSGCIRALLAHYLLHRIDDPWRFVVDNCTITRLCFDGEYAYMKSLNEK